MALDLHTARAATTPLVAVMGIPIAAEAGDPATPEAGITASKTDIGIPMSAEVTTPVPVVAVMATELDPAFAAAQALDSASEALSAVFASWEGVMQLLDPRGAMDWGDSAAVARAALGGGADGTVAALAAYERRLAALEDDVAEAEALFRATVPLSEIGGAAMRAAARRHGRRPGGRAGDAAALLGAPPA